MKTIFESILTTSVTSADGVVWEESLKKSVLSMSCTARPVLQFTEEHTFDIEQLIKFIRAISTQNINNDDAVRLTCLKYALENQPSPEVNYQNSEEVSSLVVFLSLIYYAYVDGKIEVCDIKQYIKRFIQLYNKGKFYDVFNRECDGFSINQIYKHGSIDRPIKYCNFGVLDSSFTKSTVTDIYTILFGPHSGLMYKDPGRRIRLYLWSIFIDKKYDYACCLCTGKGTRSSNSACNDILEGLMRQYMEDLH